MRTNNIFKLMAVLACTAIMVACDDDSKLNEDGQDDKDNVENVEPVFPELVEDYDVEPGSTLELVFTPNLDWKVSIPSNIRQWFWINDDSFKVTELSGEASQDPVSVYIGVTDNADFDKNYSCDVTLEMGDSSMVVAKYMLPAKEKSLEVYAALTDADGSFKMAEDGVSYQYSDQVASSLELLWSEADADFRIPVKVVSNCEWDVELPEWAEVDVPESTSGIMELVITGESLDKDAGMLVFKNDKTVLLELVAKIPSCRGVEVYSAELDNGEFIYGEGGEYQWTEKPVSEVNVAWMGTDFRMPVKVNSKCSWTLELPEWLTVKLPEKTAGEVSMTLMGVPSKYPLDDAEGKIVFKRDGVEIYVLDVSIPGCKDIMTFAIDMSLTSLDFNNRGKIRTSSGFVEGTVSGRLTGVKNVRIVTVETTGGKVGAENPAWFKCAVSSWNTASGADVIQDRTLTFEVDENYVDGIEGEDRSAVLFVLPPSTTAKISEMFNEDASVKKEYAEWATLVSQKQYPFIVVPETPADAEYAHRFEPASAEKKQELIARFGITDCVYVLTYESPYCRDNAVMSMPEEPYASFKVFSNDDAQADKSQNEDFWLRFDPSSDANDGGVVDMYREMNLPFEPSVGYVVFYGEDVPEQGDSDAAVSGTKVLAIVECVSPWQEPKFSVDKSEIIFVSDASAGSVNVTSNLSWSVVSDADWCKVAPAEGENDGVVTVSVDKNDTEEVRTATVTIRSEELPGKEPFTHVISVEQKAGAVLEVDNESLSFTYAKSSLSLKVISNVDWTITSDTDWCVVSPASGKGEQTVTVSVTRNIADASRSATLQIVSENITKTVNVTQDYDDGTLTNGDETVHFVDWNAAKKAGAVLERLTSGAIWKEFRNGPTPVYHLTYTDTSVPLRITLPEEVVAHNVNPWSYKTCFRVNDILFVDEDNEETHPEVVRDSDGSVSIHMYLPDGMTSLRGNINFTSAASDNPVIILVCTIDMSAE